MLVQTDSVVQSILSTTQRQRRTAAASSGRRPAHHPAYAPAITSPRRHYPNCHKMYWSCDTNHEPDRRQTADNNSEGGRKHLQDVPITAAALAGARADACIQPTRHELVVQCLVHGFALVSLLPTAAPRAHIDRSPATSLDMLGYMLE